MLARLTPLLAAELGRRIACYASRGTRSCVEISSQALIEAMGEVRASGTRLQDSLGLFVGVTNLWADMSVAKDMSNQIA